MNYIKLGCNWGNGTPTYYNFLETKKIVLGISNNKYQVGDRVLIMNGFQAKAIAVINQPPVSVTSTESNYKEEFDKYQIPYEEWLDVYENILWIDIAESFEYKLQAGIRNIQKHWVKRKIDSLVNNFYRMENIKDTIDLLVYKKQIILQGPPGTGKTYLAKELAKQLTNEDGDINESEYRKLIQFHPSYTYEDFVRGIVVETIDKNVSYKTTNKVFAAFAKDARDNYLLSQKNATEANLIRWITEKFEEFKNELEVYIEQEEYTLSGDITIYEVGETAFRYGKNWKHSSHLKFLEFKKLIQDVVQGKLILSNQQIPKELSVHTHYRYTYYNALLSKFFEKYTYNDQQVDIELKNYVLIIDEINRANLPSVLGELIYALEYRGKTVNSMYMIDGDSKMTIPPNLYIIGTMNTADRSVGHIDYAIRRRFAFVDVLPDESVIANVKAKALFNEVSKLFVESVEDKYQNSKFLTADFDYKDIQLGHSYFLLKDYKEEENNIQEKQLDELKMRLEYEIKPILLEYVKDGILQEDAKEYINHLQIV